MGAALIRGLKHYHDAIMDEMLANPFWTLKQLAAKTGYTPSWLSMVINSDVFREEYHRRRGDVECNVMGSIQERLGRLSHLAIERMEEKLLDTEDKDYILDAFDKVLHKAGYAPKTQQSLPPVQQQNNLFLVQKGELQELRQLMVGQPAVEIEVKSEDDAGNQGG